MRFSLTYLVTFIFFGCAGDAISQQAVDSSYTDISDKTCAKHIDDESTGAYTMTCPGVHGFKLHVLYDDERSSVNIVTPDKSVLPLNYWEVVTRGFSTLGNRVEWRVDKTKAKATPIAVIVRVNALDQSDVEHPKRVALLAVAKISRRAACVTGVVSAISSDANNQARHLADDSRVECLSITFQPKH